MASLTHEPHGWGRRRRRPRGIRRTRRGVRPCQEKIQAAARELEPRKSADESQAMVWELLVYDLERSGTSSQGGELKDWMKLMEGPPVANDIRVGSLEDFGLDLARILEHCEQVSVSL
ncbi:unnamed protein product [Durusdinium trenchii]|uniref:Uncharacterized protein n=1 Tax=Durusdinium trenchii TaxID=1381693 RepID=A0ABP0KUI9_9DINO